MRGRNKPWANDYISAHQDYIYNKDKNLKNLTLEVGIGKGKFIFENASINKDYNHIGVEVNTSIFAMALKKVVIANLENVFLLNVKAEKLKEYINENSISKLYLNFSDPWPQNGYRKRRLVHPIHLQIFEDLLVDNGLIIFKTDNAQLFEFGIKNFKDRNYEFLMEDYDYQLTSDDFETEYESKFRSLGQPIYKAIVKVNKAILKPFIEK